MRNAYKSRKKPDFWYAVYQMGFFYCKKQKKCMKKKNIIYLHLKNKVRETIWISQK